MRSPQCESGQISVEQRGKPQSSMRRWSQPPPPQKGGMDWSSSRWKSLLSQEGNCRKHRRLPRLKSKWKPKWVIAFPHPRATLNKGNRAPRAVGTGHSTSGRDTSAPVCGWETSAPFCKMAATRGAKTLGSLQTWLTLACVGWNARHYVAHGFLGWVFKTELAKIPAVFSLPLTSLVGHSRPEFLSLVGSGGCMV